MRDIDTKTITETVSRLFIDANYELGDDVLATLKNAQSAENSPIGRKVLEQIIENAKIASTERMPLCQDCGTAVIFLEIGQEVHITGGNLYDAITEGVRQGYTDGYLRKSVVSQPFTARNNSGDNTPPMINTEIIPGDRLKITVMPKGGGAENMSRLFMLKPGAGTDGIIDVIIQTVKEAGGKACPPLIVGVGIGGTADKAMLLAKKALLRPVGSLNSNNEISALEKEALEHINRLGIGPLGFGGSTTALAVHADTMPTHIASLPVGVNLQCHSARHKEAVL